MEIKQVTTVEEQNIGDMEEFQSSIRTEDLGFALGAVSKNLYANSIGSFIRELVSNGVDANVDNVNRSRNVSVEVRLYKEGNEWWFSVRDFGTGMTKDVFINVYMKWFNSDKRTTRAKIGGWGLGSKTPLAYTDQYEVETIAEGIKYSYIVVKSNPVPAATLLMEVPTKEESGTLVKFEVKEKDLDKISSELYKQLAYFNEVVVINEYKYYENNFLIIETDTFKYRPDATPLGSDMHLVMGQVAYKIDFHLLGRDRVNMPIAVKFDINDLPVTLSREDINYDTDDSDIDVIGVMNARIDAVIDEIAERYKQYLYFTNLQEFLAFQSTQTNYLDLGGTNLRIDNHIIREKARLVIGEDEYQIRKVDVPSLTVLFTECYIQASKLVINPRRDTVTVFRLFTANYIIKDTDSNHYSNKYYMNRSGLIFRKLSRREMIRLADELRLGITTKSLGRYYTVFVPGGLKKMMKLLSFIKLSLYNYLPKYSLVPQSYIDADKAAQKELVLAKKGNITSYSPSGRMSEHSLDNLLDTHHYLFYIDRKENPEKIGYYAMLFEAMPDYFKKKLKLLILNPTTIKGIKKYKSQVRGVDEVWKFKKLSNFYNRLPLLMMIHDLSQEGMKNIQVFSDYYNRELLKLKPHYRHAAFHSQTVRDLERKEDVEIEATGFLDYFKKELRRVKTDKVFIGDSIIKEVHDLIYVIRIRRTLLIYENSAHAPIYLKMINKLKLTKVNRIVK